MGTEEKAKTQRLTLRIRKYSKNVKSLHKRTSSLSGLTRYQQAPFEKEATEKTERRPDTPQITGSQDDVHALSMDDDEKEEGDDASTRSIDLRKKREELQQLEQQTLEILNQLQEETKMLVGDTKKTRNRRRNGTRGSRKRAK